MGHGSYTSADWNRLKSCRKIDTTTSEKEIFQSTCIDPRFDPCYINVRESRDSIEHPSSTPIIIGLDVTASMGYLANKIAREALNETMLKLYSTKMIEDPQLMFAAYGDYMDMAPLQVTQFESDIRIAEQLMDLWLESHGQGQVVTSLLWHFAAKHTSLDCYNKRRKKGFLITIGDNADCRGSLSENTVKRVFGPEESFVSVEESLNEAKEKFEVMHIIISSFENVPSGISKMLPGRTMVIHSSDIDALPEIIISAMQIVSGMDKNSVLKQWPEMTNSIVSNAIKNLTVGNSQKGFFF